MENFTFYSPTYCVFGKGTESQTGKLVKKYGGHKVLIHYSGESVIRSGLLDRVKASLDNAGIEHVELGGVKASPYMDLVYEDTFTGQFFSVLLPVHLLQCCWEERHGLPRLLPPRWSSLQWIPLEG